MKVEDPRRQYYRRGGFIQFMTLTWRFLFTFRTDVFATFGQRVVGEKKKNGRTSFLVRIEGGTCAPLPLHIFVIFVKRSRREIYQNKMIFFKCYPTEKMITTPTSIHLATTPRRVQKCKGYSFQQILVAREE